MSAKGPDNRMRARIGALTLLFGWVEKKLDYYR